MIYWSKPIIRLQRITQRAGVNIFLKEYFEQRKVQWTRQFRVSNEINDACFFETKDWRNKSALIVQQIIPPYYDKIQEFF